MAARYNSRDDWDPMQDDFDDTNYDAQYPNNNDEQTVQLDHRRLYITNIPKTLTEEGLMNVCQSYGTIEEIFVSRDPNKRYALVGFQTVGETRLAMMKLHKAEPLRLIVNIAHKQKKRFQDNRKENHRERDHGRAREDDDHSGRGFKDRNQREREDSSSAGSSTRKNRRQDMSTDNNVSIDNLPVAFEEDMGLESMDPDFQFQLEELKLQELRLQQAELQCKQRMLIKQADKSRKNTMLTARSGIKTNRSVTSGGKVVVANVPDRDSRDGDISYASGAGDSLTLPGLQRVGSRACVSCGAGADSYCARCGVTPYCSASCQRRDWAGRHRAVCHNLARLSVGGDAKELDDVEVPAPMPLRRPKSPLQAVNDQKDSMGSPAAQRQDRGVNRFPRGGGRFLQDRRQDKPNDNRFNGDRKDDQPRGGRGYADKLPDRSLEGATTVDQSLPPRAFRNDLPPKPREVAKPAAPSPAKQPAQSPVAQPVQKPVQKPVTQPVQKPVTQPVQSGKPAAEQKPPGVLTDATPGRKLVPKNCLIETLTTGDVILLSVDNTAEECRSSPGFVCLSMHERVEGDYQSLCEQYAADCEADNAAYTLTPGETFSYLNAEDGAWYRARCLNPALAALLDASKVVAVDPTDRCKRLPTNYEGVPEFCCLLLADNVKIGDSLKCTLQAKTANGYKVSLANVESGAEGSGEVTRWLPAVDYPTPVAKAAGQAIPEVPRPPVQNKSRAVLVDATSRERAFVRAVTAQPAFDAALHATLLYGRTAKPLSTPPQRGQVVVSRFEDGLHYRALVKRTNVNQNKYLLEYIEYGNVQVNTLENLYPCPANLDLTSQPAVTSQVTLSGTHEGDFPAAVVEYLDKMKDDCTELLLTIDDGKTSAPSGATVTLAVVKNNENINKKIEEMCTPEWKKVEQLGGDVVDLQPVMFSTLEYLDLPANGCSVLVLDVSSLQAGVVSGCQMGLQHVDYVFTTLADKMREYCDSELGREPYLPKLEELCIAQCPPYDQWFRAVYVDPEGNPGSAEARICFIDYGNLEVVPVSGLRKMLSEFVTGLPALAATLEIANFPKNPTNEMLLKALEYMKLNDEGRGELTVTKCIREDSGVYVVEAPGLLAAMLK